MQDTVSQLTAYDPSSNTASPLTGDSNATHLMGALTNAFIGVVPGANPQSPGLAGVSIDRTGKFTFDRTKFLAAFDADPQGVTKLFAQGGTADNGNVSFVSAGDRAVAGSYHVVVTQAAAARQPTPDSPVRSRPCRSRPSRSEWARPSCRTR